MAVKPKQLKICKQGHRFYKSSDCPTCPVCEAENKPEEGFLGLLSAPARRALQAVNVSKPEHLVLYSEKDLLSLHGLGKSSIPILKEVMKKQGLKFKK